MAKPRQGRSSGKPNVFGMSAAATPARGQRPKPVQRQQGIPEHVANRMARRCAIASGTPTLLGMGVFVGSYWLVSRRIFDIPPGMTLAASGACFLLGLLGLSYGVLSSSWEDSPGSLLGGEQIALNISRLRASFQAMRAGRMMGSGGDQR
jgi:drug/metabolite transporter (DMT)-like permease